MNFTLDERKFVADVKAQVMATVSPVETAMAIRFQEMTISNFGIAGVDRPRPWAPLSGSYAKKVGREIATLVVSGRLRAGVHQTGNKVGISNVDVPYALAHQFGNPKRGLPARPYFPIKSDGTCMPYTYSQVVEAGQMAMDTQL